MAKGKQAALAAQRRYEAAVEHINRLTDELVDAKRRARDFEDAAVRLPSVLEEVARLRRQNAEGSSDALERTQARASEREAELLGRLRDLGQLMLATLDRHDARMSMDDYARVVSLTGCDMTELQPEHFHSRNHRRNTRTAGQLKKHDNLVTAAQVNRAAL